MPDPNKSPLPSPIECVGVVCLRGDEVLLIKRGTAPRKGEWSIPGGRIQPGETQAEAALRELFEETKVSAFIHNKIELVATEFDGQPYNLHDYIAVWQSGDPIAGDDAAHAEFVPISKIDCLGLWSETIRIIYKAQRILTEN